MHVQMNADKRSPARNYCRALTASASLACLCVPAVAQADLVIGPRVAYYFDNSNLRTSAQGSDDIGEIVIDDEATQLLQDLFGSDEVAATTTTEGDGVTADQIGFAMAGFMANFGDDRDRFTIAAMYGEGTGNFNQLNATSGQLGVADLVFFDIGTQLIQGDIDYGKLDIEATWQRRTSEQLAFFAGARYERIEASANVFVRESNTSNIEDFLTEVITGERPPPIDRLNTIERFGTSETTLETFSVRAGATVFVPIGANAVAFANGMVHASFQPDYSIRDVEVDANGAELERLVSQAAGETSFGPDIAVGAQFVLSDDLALDLRYRAILFFPVSGPQDFSDARVNHGFNIGLSLRL